MSSHVEVQTTSHMNGLKYFDSVKNAYDHRIIDPSVYKISWTDGDIDHRFRTKYSEDVWSMESEKRMEDLSTDYKNKSPGQLFFIDQRIDIFDKLISEFDKRQADKAEPMTDEYEKGIDNACIMCITEVLTETPFFEKYCN